MTLTHSYRIFIGYRVYNISTIRLMTEKAAIGNKAALDHRIIPR